MRKEFYKKVGKAWKRGYLLYGLFAIANYLKFDIYDLELASNYKDSDLRGLLLSTPNRYIIVIEDIDCAMELPDRHGDGHGHPHPYDYVPQIFSNHGVFQHVSGITQFSGLTGSFSADFSLTRAFSALAADFQQVSRTVLLITGFLKNFWTIIEGFWACFKAKWGIFYEV